jgi:hypothetical protein
MPDLNQQFTSVGCRAQGIPSFKCENQVRCGKESIQLTGRRRQDRMIAADFAPAQEKIAGIIKFIPIRNVAIPA